MASAWTDLVSAQVPSSSLLLSLPFPASRPSEPESGDHASWCLDAIKSNPCANHGSASSADYYYSKLGTIRQAEPARKTCKLKTSSIPGTAFSIGVVPSLRSSNVSTASLVWRPTVPIVVLYVIVGSSTGVLERLEGLVPPYPSRTCEADVA